MTNQCPRCSSVVVMDAATFCTNCGFAFATTGKADVVQATAIIQAAELDLGYRLERGQRRDLLADNTVWPLAYIRAIEDVVAFNEEAERLSHD